MGTSLDNFLLLGEGNSQIEELSSLLWDRSLPYYTGIIKQISKERERTQINLSSIDLCIQDNDEVEKSLFIYSFCKNVAKSTISSIVFHRISISPSWTYFEFLDTLCNDLHRKLSLGDEMVSKTLVTDHLTLLFQEYPIILVLDGYDESTRWDVITNSLKFCSNISRHHDSRIIICMSKLTPASTNVPRVSIGPSERVLYMENYVKKHSIPLVSVGKMRLESMWQQEDAKLQTFPTRGNILGSCL